MNNGTAFCALTNYTSCSSRNAELLLEKWRFSYCVEDGKGISNVVQYFRSNWKYSKSILKYFRSNNSSRHRHVTGSAFLQKRNTGTGSCFTP